MKKSFPFVLLLLLIISCSKDKQKEITHSNSKSYSLTTSEYAPPLPPAPYELIQQPKLVKTGELRIKSAEIELTRNKLRTILFQCNGNVEFERFSNSEDQSEYNFLFNVPALDYERFIYKLDSLRLDIQEKKYMVSDETLNYIDETSRLKNKKKLEQVYLDLLSKAKTIDNIIEIQEKIEEIRSDIESKEEQLKALDNKIAFSEFSITLETPKREVKNQTDITSGNREKFSNAFKKGVTGIIDSLAFLISIWPIYLIIGLLYVLFLFLRKRIRLK